MKITIDTKEDSHEEIRKVIRLLRHLIGDSGESSNIFSNVPAQEPAGNILGILDSPATAEAKNADDDDGDEEEPQTPPTIEVVEY